MNRRGFTLIELMIVIAIISILASIIIPNITRARERAKLTACLQNFRAIITARMMFEADGGVPWESQVALENSPLYPDYISGNAKCPAAPDGWYDVACCSAHDGDRFHIECHNSDDQCYNHEEILADMTGCGSCGGPDWHMCSGVQEWGPFIVNATDVAWH